MVAMTPILASSDTDGIVKLIGAVIVLSIWGISSLAAAVRKSKQEALRKQLSNPAPLPTAAAAAPPGRPPPLPRTTVAPQRRTQIPPRLVAQTAAPLPPLSSLATPRAVQARQQPRPTRSAVTPPALTPPAVIRAASAPVSKAPARPQDAPDRISALLRPAGVRAQFILAEVLQPPLALRKRNSI